MSRAVDIIHSPYYWRDRNRNWRAKRVYCPLPSEICW